MFGRVSIFGLITVLASTLVHFLYPDLLSELWSRYKSQIDSDDSLPEGEKLFTVDELKSYVGEKPGFGPYLAVLGRVYDVSSGMQHYGPEGGYNQFTGKDATRSFVTGDFSAEGLSDDVTGLSHQQMLAIDNWIQFYNKDYVYVGRLIGRYYSSKGQPTDELQNALAVIAAGKKQVDREAEERNRFPGCNSEWSDETGGRVWCSPRSGGVQRDWTGVPRQLFTSGTGQTRCVCVHPSELQNSQLREYPGCLPTSITCALPSK